MHSFNFDMFPEYEHSNTHDSRSALEDYSQFITYEIKDNKEFEPNISSP